jgi:YHS domain-containing protein
MMKKFLLAAGISVMIGACSSNQNQPEQKAVPEKVAMANESGIKLNDGMLVSKNDTVCGMEVGNEPGDTATVDGKLYGFCSSGCKDSFLAEHKK